jgi:DNA-binding MarR family transcriptional regulator
VNLPLSQINGFADLGRALTRFQAFGDSLRDCDVTPLEYYAMLVMKTLPGETVTSAELARQLKLNRAISGQLAEKLVSSGFALRGPSVRPAAAAIELTPKGDQIVAKLAAVHLHELRSLEQLLAEALPRLRGG